MPRESKKGACSSHTKTATIHCLKHNRRESVASYVNPHRSQLNRTITEDRTISKLKSIKSLIERARMLYTEKTGQRCQASFAPYRESVWRIKETTSDDEIKAAIANAEKTTGWKCIGAWIHLDEGHAKSKYIEGEAGWECNPHVHVLWACQDPITGKVKHADRKTLSQMQDDLAAGTNMERGFRAGETGRQHLDHQTYRIAQQEERIEKLTRTAEYGQYIVDEFKQDHKKVSAETKKKKEELDQTNKDLVAAKAALKQAETRVKGLTTMIANLDARKNEIEQEIEKAKTEGNKSIADLQNQYNNLLTQIKEKKEKLEEANRILQAAEESKKIIDQATEEAKKDLEKTNEDLTDAKSKLESTRDKIKRLNTMIDDLEDEKKKLTKNVEWLNSVFKTTRSKDDALSFEIIRKREELDGYERNLAKLEATLADKREKLEQATEDLNEMESKVTAQAEKYGQLKDAARILGTEFSSKNTDTIKQFAKASICDVVMSSFSKIFQSMDDTSKRQFADSDIQNVLDSGQKVTSVASMLFLGMVGAAMEATQAASAAGGGGGGGGSDLPWDGRRDDEDDTKFMRRCVSHAAKLCSRKGGIGGQAPETPRSGGRRR